jgi:hypothetical protein
MYTGQYTTAALQQLRTNVWAVHIAAQQQEYLSRKLL